MNILIVTTSYLPAYGGAETHCRILCEGLVQEGHNITLLTHANEPTWPVAEDIGGVRILRTRAFHKRLYEHNRIVWEEALFGSLTEIQTLLGKARFDIVHAQNQAAALICAFLKDSLSCPLLLSFHETEPEVDPFGTSRSRFIFSCLPYDMIIAGSKQFVSQALQFGAKPRSITLVYQGINAPQPADSIRSSSVRRRYGIAPDSFLLVQLARFKPRKRQLCLLRATRKATRTDPKIHLCLSGSCNSASEQYFGRVREYSERCLRDGSLASTVCRDISNADVCDLLATANAGVLISEKEGLGLALLEYMSHGLPVIARDVPGINEIVKHMSNGLLLATDAENELTEAILTLSRSASLCSSLGQGGKATVERFLASDMIKNTVSVYRRVLGDGS